MELPISQIAEPITDGQLTVSIKGGDSDNKAVVLDLLLTKLAIEQVEGQYGVKEGFKATPEFLMDLTKAIQNTGFPQCTPTLAYQLWHKIAEAWLLLKKSTPETPSSPSGMEPQLVP